ncbi:alginate export family protein [Pseudomonas atacamensis]|uniref:alginate export family protein n=1 Tax=Pseudomonas atacamensis TaxID=2565368 RepID=UPI00344D6F36
MNSYSKPLLCSSLLCGVSLAMAQEATQLKLPPVSTIAWADNPLYLADEKIRRNDPLGSIRYIPLSDDARDYLAIGGEVRYQYQDYQHALLGVGGKDNPNSMLQQRLRLSADLNLSNGLRVFTELGDNREFFSERVSRFNRDKTDLQQMFVEYSMGDDSYGVLNVRGGRFVMPMGSVRLAGLREGANVRYTYDGVKLGWQTPGKTRWELFSVSPTQIDPLKFDDQRDKHQDFSGLYGTAVWSPLDSNIDVFAYTFGRDNAVYTSVAGNERRNSYGVRFYRQSTPWDYDIEAVVQGGNSGGQDIRAWGLMTQAGYTFKDVPLTPRLGFRANAFSGDDDPNDNTLGDFVAPALASGLVYTDANWFTATNMINVAPVASLKLTQDVKLEANVDVLMRESTKDGIYYLPTAAPYAPNQGNARHVATNTNFLVDWRVNRFTTVHAMYTHVQAGAALEDIGGKDTDYIGIYTQFVF